MDKLESLVVRLEKAVQQLETGNVGGAASGAAAGSAGASGDAGVESASVRDYSSWITGSVSPFIELSEKIGGDVAKMGQLWQE